MLDVKMGVEERGHNVEQSDVCKCSELKLRCERAEEKCEELELKIQIKKIECELLQGQMKELESEKSVIKQELKVWMEKGREPGQQVSCAKDGKKICFEDVEKGVVNLVDKNDVENKVVQLLIENSVLTVEKKEAESEAEMWKDKFKTLEIRISKLDESFIVKGDEPRLSARFKGGIGSPLSPDARVFDGVVSNCHSLSKEIRDLQAGTPPNGSPHNHIVSLGRGKEFRCIESYFKHGNRVRKQLNFDEESPRKEMAPLSTPAVSRPFIISIDDSDDESIIDKLPAHNQKKSEDCVSAAQEFSECGSIGSEEKIQNENNLRESHCGTKHMENMEDFSDDFVSNSTPKRKRASNIITSDTENDDDDDDNVPICKLKRMPLLKTNHTLISSKLNDGPATATSACDKAMDSASPARRRLVSLRNCYEKGSGKKDSSNQIIGSKNRMKDVEYELEDIGSEQESESESLDQFIVDSSDFSDVGSASQSTDSSNFSEGYEEIISKLGRRKKELKWEYEADMLAAFGKDLELCMKAVCALYRQQTSEERVSKESLFSNKRGFSKFDAIKGTRLAEFLTDGDPRGNLNKSVRELQAYDPKAIDLCRKLATHYSKQLFEIYVNKEDPFFLPA